MPAQADEWFKLFFTPWADNKWPSSTVLLGWVLEVIRMREKRSAKRLQFQIWSALRPGNKLLSTSVYLEIPPKIKKTGWKRDETFDHSTDLLGVAVSHDVPWPFANLSDMMKPCCPYILHLWSLLQAQLKHMNSQSRRYHPGVQINHDPYAPCMLYNNLHLPGQKLKPHVGKHIGYMEYLGDSNYMLYKHVSHEKTKNSSFSWY